MRCRFCDQDADYFVAGDPLCTSCDAIHRADLEDDAAMRAELIQAAAKAKGIKVIFVKGASDAS